MPDKPLPPSSAIETDSGRIGRVTAGVTDVFKVVTLTELRGSSALECREVSDAFLSSPRVVSDQPKDRRDDSLRWATQDSAFLTAQFEISRAKDLFAAVTDIELELECLSRLRKSVVFQRLKKWYSKALFACASNFEETESGGQQQRGLRVRTFENISNAELEQEIEKRLELGVEFHRLAAWFSNAGRSDCSPSGAPLMGRERWAPTKGGPYDNPAAFIRRVYGAELDAGTLKREELSSIDYKLSVAYASWIRPGRHPEDSIWPDVDGSRRQDRELLSSMSAEQRLQRDRARQAEASTRIRLKKRQSSPS